MSVSRLKENPKENNKSEGISIQFTKGNITSIRGNGMKNRPLWELYIRCIVFTTDCMVFTAVLKFVYDKA